METKDAKIEAHGSGAPFESIKSLTRFSSCASTFSDDSSSCISTVTGDWSQSLTLSQCSSMSSSYGQIGRAIEELPSERMLRLIFPSRSLTAKSTAYDVRKKGSSELLELQAKVERVTDLLQQLSLTGQLLQSATDCIIKEAQQNLNSAFTFISNSRGGILRRAMSDVSKNTLRKVSLKLDDSLANLSWLLRMLASIFRNHEKGSEDEEIESHLGLPPISAKISPSLCFIWEQQLKLLKGSHRGKVAAAAMIVLLARDNARFRKVIIEEGGVVPLVNLLRETDGPVDARESAAYALGLFASDAKNAKAVIQSADLCSVFVEVLRQSPIMVQAKVAWAISELAEHYPDCQDMFSHNGGISLLIGHLTCEKSPPNTHGRKVSEDETDQSGIYHPLVNHEQQFLVQPMITKPAGSCGNTVGDAITNPEKQKLVVPVSRVHLNGMAARALSNLIKGNSAVCKNLIEFSNILPYLTENLAKGTQEVQSNSAVALLEIVRIVYRDADVMQAFVRANPPAISTTVDLLIRIVEEGKHSNHLLLCSIEALGCLSKIFEMTENRIIGPLVRLLDDGNPEVMHRSAAALAKFAEPSNSLHLKNCKVIIDEGGVRHLVQLVYFGELAQLPAILVLCYVTNHLPHNEEVIQADVLAVLRWASMQSHIVKDIALEQLLQEAIFIAKIYKTS